MTDKHIMTFSASLASKAFQGRMAKTLAGNPEPSFGLGKAATKNRPVNKKDIQNITFIFLMADLLDENGRLHQPRGPKGLEVLNFLDKSITKPVLDTLRLC
jgi:hypothetical protein